MPDPIARLNNALAGRYRIERQLGEGGMATVYLADDLRHERKVALKVLKPELAAVVGAERFLAEIKTTAKLQHPHILPLHDSGQADSFLFYVMPYVEGESLRDRLDREHQLPVDEAVRIATNVAEALDYAHRHGVIHRDIKPANILLQDGKPVVSDFGIALAVSSGGGGRLTETGLSLGTPHYMSPEQATGDLSIGAASDIYALGCVLYETLAGHPPYIGGTAQAILGKIVTGDADPVSRHRRAVPANVDAAIRRALEKVPADRFARAQELSRALGDASFRHGREAAAVLARAAGPWKAIAATFAVLFLIASGVAVRALTRPGPRLPVARFESPFQEGQEPTAFGTDAFTLSPDGRLLVYRGPGGGDEGAAPLWLRRWDDPVATQIREVASIMPDVSPDGRQLAYVERGPVIRVTSFDGGPTTNLVDGSWPRWGPDGNIYFTTTDQALARVPATGGRPELLQQLRDGVLQQHWEDFLPGGDVALVRQVIAEPEFGALRIATGEYARLDVGYTPRYASTGHVLFLASGTLMAAPLDAHSLRMGEAVPLLDSVIAYTTSDAGSLVYTTGSMSTAGPVEPVWVSRSGDVEPVDRSETGWVFEAGIGRGGSYGWHLSPDGTRAAVTRLVEGNTDVWIKTLPDGPFRRLTSDDGDETSPFWSPDGSTVAYNRGANGTEVWRRRADGTGIAEPLVTSGTNLKVQGVWSPDGEWMVVRGAGDVWWFRPGVDSVVTALLATDFNERGPALSPDGRWLAYSSNQSGREEVYVRPFPDVDASLEQVSVDGGSNPVWAHSGSELFFIDSERRMNVARVEANAPFEVLGREILFPLTPELVGFSNGDGGDDLYDVAPGDQRFLMGRLVEMGRGRTVEVNGARENRNEQRLVLVENFFEELRRRVPVD